MRNSGIVVMAFLGLMSGCTTDLPKVTVSNENFVEIPSGEYVLGYKDHHINPIHTVWIDKFYISKTEVTNSEWKKFIDETGYVTSAEQLGNAMTFYPGLDEYKWVMDSTANWKFPFGKNEEGIQNKMDHPVTCISFVDIMVYCEWANVRLPDLDEWEIACRAHSKGYQFFEDRNQIYRYANIWRGENHLEVAKDEDYLYTAPVKSFHPNTWGIYDMYGNVFEFCADTRGLDSNETKKVCARGGSWWCSTNSCNFFNSVDIGTVHRLASFSNHGFRVIKL